jgi:hypothetical protein
MKTTEEAEGTVNKRRNGEAVFYQTVEIRAEVVGAHAASSNEAVQGDVDAADRIGTAGLDFATSIKPPRTTAPG